MALAIMLLGLPLLIYIVLVTMKPGFMLTIALVLVALLLGYIWIGYLLSWEPLWTGDRRADAYTLAAANLYTIAGIAGAATATLGRRYVARSDLLPYPVVALAILVIMFVPLFILFGV